MKESEGKLTGFNDLHSNPIREGDTVNIIIPTIPKQKRKRITREEKIKSIIEKSVYKIRVGSQEVELGILAHRINNLFERELIQIYKKVLHNQMEEIKNALK